MVEPGAEDTRRPQLATVLVRHEIVGIVGAQSVVAEVAHRLAVGEAAGEHAVLAVRLPRAAAEHVVDIAPLEPALLARKRVEDPGVFRDRHSIGIELRQVAVDGVVAERVVEVRGDDLRAGRHLGIRRWVELDLIGVAGRIGHPESRSDAALLAAGDQPAVERDCVESIGAAPELLQRQVMLADPIDEPARVGDLVDRIHVHRAHVRRARRVPERVHEEVVAAAVVDRHDFRRVARRVIVRPEGIVRVERRLSVFRRLARTQYERRHEHEADDEPLRNGHPRRYRNVCHRDSHRRHRPA